MMRYFIALFFITLHGYALSQRENTLVVNKIFTDPVVLRLEGNTSQTVSIKDLRGKKIILDLFTSSCVVCFKMLPKLDSLQRKFKDHLRFILIGKEDASIRSIYNRFEKKLGLQLDKGFDSAFFNHMRITYVPTYIWIDEKGLVKAVTGVEELREDNIIRFLDNKEIQSKVLTQAVAFDPRQLLLVNGNGGDENDYVSRTVISKWNPTLPFYIPPLLQSSRDGPFFQTLGASLPELYNYAYFGLPHWNSKHNNYGHVFPSPLLEDSLATTGNEKYCYSYFRSGMDTTALSIQWIMQNELKSYFGCEARVVTRLMPCWELVQTKPGSIGKANVSVTSEKVSYAGFEFTSVPVSRIIEELWRYHPFQPPYIDKTGINYPIDISAEAILTDFEDFRRGLQAAGFALQRGLAPMKVIILEFKIKNVAAK